MHQREVTSVIDGYDWRQCRVQAKETVEIDSATRHTGRRHIDGAAMSVVIRVAIGYQRIQSIGSATLKDAHQDVTVGQ